MRPLNVGQSISVTMLVTWVTWSALAWGERLAALRPGFECRLAREGEAPSIDLHAPADRAPLSVARLQAEFGWQAGFGMDASADHLEAWCRHHAPSSKEVS